MPAPFCRGFGAWTALYAENKCPGLGWAGGSVWRAGAGTFRCPALQGQRSPGSGSLTHTLLHLPFRVAQSSPIGTAVFTRLQTPPGYFFCAARMYPMTILT